MKVFITSILLYYPPASIILLKFSNTQSDVDIRKILMNLFKSDGSDEKSLLCICEKTYRCRDTSHLVPGHWMRMARHGRRKQCSTSEY